MSVIRWRLISGYVWWFVRARHSTAQHQHGAEGRSRDKRVKAGRGMRR